MNDNVNTVNLAPSFRSTAVMLCTVIENGTPEGRAMACDEITDWGKLLDESVVQRNVLRTTLFAIETLIHLQGINELVPYAQLIRRTLKMEG